MNESLEALQMKSNTPTWIIPLSGGFSLVLIYALLLVTPPKGVTGSTFTFVNTCNHTVWPAIYSLPPSVNSSFASTGFELPKGTARSLEAPSGWNGRLWGRTGCNFDRSGYGSCLTGDCGSGRVQCSGNAESQPVTIAEFGLDISEQDFYDVSLVEGFNLPIYVEAEGRLGPCESTGCIMDVNQICPEELKVGKDGMGEGCMHPCQALGRAEYCCTGAYSSPEDCTPNVYSQMFKAACPRSYSYAYDDATSTFTCTDADFTITFCAASRFSY